MKEGEQPSAIGTRSKRQVLKRDMEILTNAPTDVLVALVGFPHPLPKNAVGIFQRCGLSVFASDNLAKVARLMRTLELDALVVDTHSPHLGDIRSVMKRLLRIREACRRKNDLPLVVLMSEKCTPTLRSTLAEASAVQLPTTRQTYRELARVLRQLSGLTDPCCGLAAQSSL
jgi:hypothetical protein